MLQHRQCPCFQYADHTTLYLHSKFCDLDERITELNCAMTRLENDSIDFNLASKTKYQQGTGCRRPTT